MATRARKKKSQPKTQAQSVAIPLAQRLDQPMLELHRRRAKQLLNARLPKRVPYPQYLQLVDLIATFKVESGSQPMVVRFS